MLVPRLHLPEYLPTVARVDLLRPTTATAEARRQRLFRRSSTRCFFIGDGINSNSGSPQRFIVPANATELWLGFADAIDFTGPPAAYGDNVGSLIVSGTLFQSSPSLAADLFLRIQPSATTVHQGDLITYAFPVWNLGPDNAVHEVLNDAGSGEGTTLRLHPHLRHAGAGHVHGSALPGNGRDRLSTRTAPWRRTPRGRCA